MTENMTEKKAKDQVTKQSIRILKNQIRFLESLISYIKGDDLELARGAILSSYCLFAYMEGSFMEDVKNSIHDLKKMTSN